jgi:hypothetical protein
MRNILAGSHTKHQWGCSKTKVNISQGKYNLEEAPLEKVPV